MCHRNFGIRGGVDKPNTLFRVIVALYQQLRTVVRELWKRDLPFSELLFDRWERAKSLGFGEGASIYHNSYVYGEVKVGKNTWIGPYTLLDGSGGLEIGDNCSISASVHIYTHDTVKWAVSGGRVGYERSPVRIGNCCYVGSHTVIAKGVTIGDHCVIGACSFVNRDIPPHTIAFGIPCRPVGRVVIDESWDVTLVLDTQSKVPKV
jgi:acetyltransferase-like isoleucine patch superfamily enzyme